MIADQVQDIQQMQQPNIPQAVTQVFQYNEDYKYFYLSDWQNYEVYVHRNCSPSINGKPPIVGLPVLILYDSKTGTTEKIFPKSQYYDKIFRDSKVNGKIILHPERPHQY